MAAINAKLQPFGSLDTHIFSALLDLTETEVLVDTLILNDSRDFFLNLTPEKLVIYLREYDIIWHIYIYIQQPIFVDWRSSAEETNL